MSEDFLKDIRSIEVNVRDVITSIRKKIHAYIHAYNLRHEDIKGIALGPNEFNSFRIEIVSKQRIYDHRLPISRDVELIFEGIPIYCAPRTGIQILLDHTWYVQVQEARKYLNIDTMDA